MAAAIHPPNKRSTGFQAMAYDRKDYANNFTGKDLLRMKAHVEDRQSRATTSEEVTRDAQTIQEIVAALEAIGYDDNEFEMLKWAGSKRINEALPPVLRAKVSDHSTGFQVDISAHAEGHPSVTVWRHSTWYAGRYEFNERGKVRGFQPATEWAHKAVTEAFAKLADMKLQEEDAKAARSAACRQEIADAEQCAAQVYASMLGN
jgi:hypothetical protein